MRLAAGTDPAQTRRQVQLCSLTIGRSSQIHASESGCRSTAVIPLPLLLNLTCRVVQVAVFALFWVKTVLCSVQWDEFSRLCGRAAVPSPSKDHTQDKLARAQRKASENRKEDAARMSAGSLHEIAHTMEHVFNVSHFLLSSSVFLFGDNSWDLSQLPHFLRLAVLKLCTARFEVINRSQIKPFPLFAAILTHVERPE